MSDFRETRVSAIVSRRRQQIARLEETLRRVRLQLAEDEQRLRELQSKRGRGKRESCVSAGRTLRNCAQNGDADDSVCGDAARVLANCRKR